MRMVLIATFIALLMGCTGTLDQLESGGSGSGLFSVGSSFELPQEVVGQMGGAILVQLDASISNDQDQPVNGEMKQVVDVAQKERNPVSGGINATVVFGNYLTQRTKSQIALKQNDVLQDIVLTVYQSTDNTTPVYRGSVDRHAMKSSQPLRITLNCVSSAICMTNQKIQFVGLSGSREQVEASLRVNRLNAKLFSPAHQRHDIRRTQDCFGGHASFENT